MSIHSHVLKRFYNYKQKPPESLTSQAKLDKVLKSRDEALARRLLQKEKLEEPAISEPQVIPEEDGPLFPPEIQLPPSIEDTGNTISLELFSKDDLLIKMSIFASGPLKEAIQGSAGVYCKEFLGWVLPVRMYRDFKSKAEKIRGISIKELPDFVVRALASKAPGNTYKYQWNFSQERVRSLEDVPDLITDKLYPFQKEGVEFALEHYGRVLIGDEMGVGKTIQGIAVACAYREEWPVFLICPASLKFNWRAEFMRWVPELEKKDFYILDSRRTMKNRAKVWISSYTMATHLEDMLNTKFFQVVIADESHYLKNYNAKRTKSLLPFIQKARRVILLSGTPVISKPSELFTQLCAIRPDIFNSFRVFAERYCDPKIMANYTDYSGSSNVKELFTVLSNTSMIRRLKSDVLSQLPSKARQKIEISVNQDCCRRIKRLYYEVKRKKSYFKEANQSIVGPDIELAAKKMETDIFMSKAYTLSSTAKLHGVAEYVSYLVQNDCKFIIFGHHIEMLDTIENQVIKENAKYIRIDGRTSAEDRHRGVTAFQNKKDCKVAILSIQAAGQGLTLTAASTVVMAEMSWTPGLLIQAEDRAHRIGQEKCVNIHYLYGPGTLDEYIWPKIQVKLSVINATLDDNQNIAVESLLNPTERMGMGDFNVDIDLFSDLLDDNELGKRDGEEIDDELPPKKRKKK